MFSKADRIWRSVSGGPIVLAIVLLVALVSIPAAGYGSSTQDEGGVRVPLEAGRYEDLEIDAGETLTYEIDLRREDEFHVTAAFDAEHDLDVTVVNADGAVVGFEDGDDEHSVVSILRATRDETYTVEVENQGADATFSLTVVHETERDEDTDIDSDDDLLEPMVPVDRRLGPGETLTVDVELAPGDELAAVAIAGPVADLKTTLTDPTGAPVGTEADGDDFRSIALVDPDDSGVYTLEITHRNDEANATFTLQFDRGPSALRTGTEIGTIHVHKPLSRTIALAEGDDLEMTATGDASDLQVVVHDPTAGNAGTVDGGSESIRTRVTNAETTGLYLVWLVPTGSVPITYELDVDHETESDRSDTDDGSDDFADENDADEHMSSSEPDDGDGSTDGGTADGSSGFGTLLALGSVATATLIGYLRRADRAP